MTPTPPHAALLTALKIIATNRYRIGDCVALATLRSYIESHRAPNTPLPQWSMPDAGDVALMNTIMTAIGMPGDWETAPEHPGEAYHPFDDVNLWLWSDVFFRGGYRLPNTPPTCQWSQGKIILAPLAETDYSQERQMHPRFIEELTTGLLDAYNDDLLVLVPDNVTMYTYRLLQRTGATLISASLESAIAIASGCRLFIGGDTGLSHIVGTFGDVAQIALHDRGNTEDWHHEQQRDHKRYAREKIQAIREVIGDDTTNIDAIEYRSFPNKQSATCLLFDYGGTDGRTVLAVREAAHSHLSQSMEAV
jgi:hypothetical protein